MTEIVIDTEDFDDMHHALGGSGPGELYYRNFFCTDAGGDKARRFEALGYWTLRRLINEGRDAVYYVNAAGKEAHAAWLRTLHGVSHPLETNPC